MAMISQNKNKNIRMTDKKILHTHPALSNQATTRTRKQKSLCQYQQNPDIKHHQHKKENITDDNKNLTLGVHSLILIVRPVFVILRPIRAADNKRFFSHTSTNLPWTLPNDVSPFLSPNDGNSPDPTKAFSRPKFPFTRPWPRLLGNSCMAPPIRTLRAIIIMTIHSISIAHSFKIAIPSIHNLVVGLNRTVTLHSLRTAQSPKTLRRI